MPWRGSISVSIAMLLASIAAAQAFDDTKYPDLFGVWRRVNLRPGGQPSFDPTKPWGRGQQAPLTPEYQAIHEESLADQANGGQGNWQGRLATAAAEGLKAVARDKLTWLDGLMAGKPFVGGSKISMADILLFPFIDFMGNVKQPLDPATSTREIRLLPSREGVSNSPAITIGGPTTQMADLKIDESRSPYHTFRITIDRIDQGRVAVLNNMDKDSNGHLRIALNSSALGPGNYQLTVEGLDWRGQPQPDSWVTIGIQR